MIVNIEQRKGKLIVSYINKEGDISFMQLNIPASHQYIYVYSKNRNDYTPGIKSWDGKLVKKLPTEFLSRYRIQEFFMDAGEELTAPLFERNSPNLYSCDIEVDVDDETGFAEPELANNRINTIAWSHYPNVTVFGLKHLDGPTIDSIEKKVNKHLEKLGREWKFLYKEYQNEADMLYDFLYNYARLAPLITGWNFWNYDWRYISNRCKNIHLDISWMSPSKQWYKHKIMDRNQRIDIFLPQHKLIVDYMEIYKKWDRVVDPKENASLDFAADAALGITKVKYPGSFSEQYRKDYDLYVFYNAIDACLVEEIHNKLKTMGIFLGLGNITRVEAMNAFSPISMLEATSVRYAYKRGWIFPQSRSERTRENYEGAFVFNPTPDLYEWVASFDFNSLYPTIMRQWKISIENFIEKNKNRRDIDNLIKCSSGAIFDPAGEPLLPEILTDYYAQRKKAQKIGKDAEKDLAELEKILKERETSSSEAIV
ncbi:MAG: DNA polymerase domain-containing protein [Candidatus Nanoarchaeia archaeon]|nr:DNA polymerase domain-containing protein [Candidatus Nanoarchaeia archaeon]